MEPSLRDCCTHLTDEEIRHIRAQVPAAQASIWLNAGMLGPLPRPAIDAMADAHAAEAEVRADSDYWERLATAQATARRSLGSIVGVEPGHVSLMHSTHEGISTCLWGLAATSGDSIVTTDEEHPGVLVPLRHVRDRTGCSVRVARHAWGGSGEHFIDAILACVDDTTRAVVASHVSWQSGEIAPLRLLGSTLPSSCRLIVDGAQSAGVLPIDPADGWDAYTISGQKWPCGPSGTGGLVLRDPEAWLPTFGAYMQVADPSDCLGSAIVSDGRRFETSQEALAPLLGLIASIDWLVGRVGVARAHSHAQRLNTHARAAITQTLGIPASSMRGAAHLLCIDLDRGDAHETARRLAARGIMLRSLSERRLRISIGAWNTIEDLDACTAAIADEPDAPAHVDG